MLNDYNVFETFMDVDGETKRSLNTPLLDNFINSTVPPGISEYFATQVVVVNTSGISGLATQKARLISHEGFDVIRIIDGDEITAVNEIKYASKELQMSSAGKRLEVLIDPLVQTVENVDEYRSDVVILLSSPK
jgi:hypothetical protein